MQKADLSSNNSAIKQMDCLFKAHIPFIWVTTHEEERFVNTLFMQTTEAQSLELWTWSSYQGLVRFDPDTFTDQASGDMAKTQKADIALSKIMQYSRNSEKRGSIWIMKDFNTVLSAPVARQMRDMYKILIQQQKTIVILSAGLSHGPSASKPGIEPSLDKQIIVVDYSLPNRDLVEKRLERAIDFMKENNKNKSNFNYEKSDYNKFSTALQGLTELEIDNAIATCISSLSKLDERRLLQEKKQIVQKGEILEYIDQAPSMDEVGGLDAAKKYFDTYSNQFTTEAKEYGVEPLRGVLLTGCPGTGKSLIAKAIASLWNLPLLRLDVGKVMSGLVGSSEQKMRSVIQQVEAISPAILWIDEIEKSLSGTKSSNMSVSGYEKIWIKIDNSLEYTTMHNLHKLYLVEVKNIEMLALNPVTFKLEWKKIIKSIEHSLDKNLYKVKTSSGREVVATSDHSFVTLNNDGELEEILTQNTLGKLIPFAKNIPIESKYCQIDFSKYNTKRTHHKMEIVELDREFGQFIGLFLAEGSINQDSVQFACSESDIIQFIFQQIKKIWPSKNISHSYGAIQISSRPFSDWLRENFVLGASEKQIPEFLIETPMEFRLGIIEGAISGDGSACYTNSNSMDLQIHSSSIDLLYGYMMILNSLNVRVTIKMPILYPSAAKNENNKPCGAINICSLDYHLFNPVLKRKSFNIAKYQPGLIQTHRPTDRIPLPKNVIKKLGLNKYNTKQEILRTKMYRGRLSAEKVIEYLQDVPDSKAKNQLLTIAQGDVRWDIVQSIELVEPEETVFDIEIEDNHTFTLASGLVVHNSDGGTLARVFGTLLTAMEERMEGIITIATSNDIQALPPELIRRFNEVLFVDLPVPSERQEIFEIHLKKRGRDPKKLKLKMKALVAASHLFTGSEIEKSVTEAIARAFRTGKKDVGQKEILGAIKDTKCIAKVMADKINAIREWARNKARYASSLAEAAAAPGKQKVITDSGKELDLASDLDNLDEVEVKGKKKKVKNIENFSQFDNLLDD